MEIIIIIKNILILLRAFIYVENNIFRRHNILLALNIKHKEAIINRAP
jgi:hypothetical protein